MQHRILCLGTILAVGLVLLSASGARARHNPELRIASAHVDQVGAELQIYGEDFDDKGEEPTVVLGDTQLNVTFFDARFIAAELPLLEPGSYVLQVSTGKGSKDNAWFSVTVGAVGADGLPGVKGATGPKGDTGAVGPMGLTGANGDKGEQGEPGAIGPMGPMGLTGANGDKGEQGEPGAMGATGPMGPRGEAGAFGPQGPRGDKGEDGETGAVGAAGARGPQGEQGETGARGADGQQGLRGLQGAAGPQGEDGPPGPQGTAGLTGSQGPIGPVGLKGAAGPAGPQGVVGPVGPVGATGGLGKTCAAGEVMTGVRSDGQLQCTSLASNVAALVNARCHLYLGWRDVCDGCGDPPVKVGRVNDAECTNVAGGDNSCIAPTLAGTTVRMFGLNTDGNVDGNDKFYVGLKCF